MSNDRRTGGPDLGGTDIGKNHYHCVVVDAEGKRLLSRRVRNDEPELLTLLADVLAIDEGVI
jgi:hypothetical protein